MAGKMKNLTMQVTEDVANHLKDVAERRHMSIAELMKEGAGTHADYDDKFIEGLKNFAASMELPLWLVVQNYVLLVMNMDKAMRDVWGTNDDFVGRFVWNEDGPVSAQEMADMYYERFYRREAPKKAAVLRSTPMLLPHEQEWLEEYNRKEPK